MAEVPYNQINIEKVENGFVISKQTISKGLFGNSAKRFEPHIAKTQADVVKIVKEMIIKLESSKEIEAKGEKNRVSRFEEPDDDEDDDEEEK